MRYTEISQGGQHDAEVYLDMDGVLADFFTEYAKLAGIESGNYRDIPPAKTDPTLNKMIGTDFFARLPKFSTADSLVAMVVKIFGGYNICSSPLRGDHANSEKQKKIWLAKHLNPQPRQVIITPRKEKHAVQPDGTPNILIDDRGDNITRWEAAGGVGIKYQADEDGLDVVVRGLRRAVDIIRGEREHDPQQLTSKDRSLPVATGQDKVNESLYVDVPNEDWLAGKIEYAKERGRNSFGVPYLGSQTARPQEEYFRLPVNLLKHLPGMRDEQRNVRPDDLKAIIKIMKDTGKLPLMSNGKEYRPFINVAWNGEAWVNEGNHRIMAAAALGWDTLPVELRYFDGGERVKSGPLYPAKIGLGHPPVDESWKKALATGALAAATALGTPALGAGLPDLVAVVIMNINGNIVRKEINLGNEYSGPTEAAQAIDKFMTSKGIKNYSLEIQRVPAKKVDENFADGKVKGERQGVAEAFDKPYKGKWEHGDESHDMLVKLPDGSNLSIMFSLDYGAYGDEEWTVEFWRNNSQEVTGEGDQQRIFATVLNAIQKFIKKYHPERLRFSANKDVEPGQKSMSRTNLYNKLVQRYANSLGYSVDVDDFADTTVYNLHTMNESITEGKQPGQAVVDAILRVMPVAQEIWFHGSRATGRHRKNSDTDILVVVPDNLVGDKYLGAVRILQKLNSHFNNYDIQPTKTGTNIHRIAQEEGRLLWSKQGVAENFADGKVKGKSRPGRVKRAGASCNGSVSDLRAKAKKYGGEKGKMYHWCANMKGGKK